MKLRSKSMVDILEENDRESVEALSADRELVEASSADQHFLVNFIVSTYLGPDVYADNPRCSASQRLANGLPPYTASNLGDSSLRVSQLESLYYYVLRNAHPSLIFNPHMLAMYLKGQLQFWSSGTPEDSRQFTSFFPLNIHGHKTYTAGYEIVKGIVLIEDPVTSYMKKEDLERFRNLSGMDCLTIDARKCLRYEHGSHKSREAAVPNCIPNSNEKISGTRNERSSAMFRETYKRRHVCTPLMPVVPHGVSTSKGHNEESTIGSSCKLKDLISDDSITLTGTASRGITGPPIGMVDIGISKAAYFFQVALPGVQRDFCEFSCEIESDGKVHIQGSVGGGKIVRKRSRVFHMKFQQLCPPGPFALSFNLPGRVDPRLFSPNFRSDGIFEAVIIKQK